MPEDSLWSKLRSFIVGQPAPVSGTPKREPQPISGTPKREPQPISGTPKREPQPVSNPEQDRGDRRPVSAPQQDPSVSGP
jgi:hypothetical protein